jgi:hypothetical protein
VTVLKKASFASNWVQVSLSFVLFASGGEREERKGKEGEVGGIGRVGWGGSREMLEAVLKKA